jgi:methionyl-tRNA synthetase
MAGWYTRRKNKSEYEAALCEKAERYGEQRAVEAICKWLLADRTYGLVCEWIADEIERGEWREKL